MLDCIVCTNYMEILQTQTLQKPVFISNILKYLVYIRSIEFDRTVEIDLICKICAVTFICMLHIIALNVLLPRDANCVSRNNPDQIQVYVHHLLLYLNDLHLTVCTNARSNEKLQLRFSHICNTCAMETKTKQTFGDTVYCNLTDAIDERN